MARKLTFTVALNGTGVNKWHAMGLRQNPFPQIAEYQYAAHLLYLAGLGGDPIPCDDYANYIANYLEGWSDEFVKGCIARFVPGKYVEFTCHFNID